MIANTSNQKMKIATPHYMRTSSGRNRRGGLIRNNPKGKKSTDSDHHKHINSKIWRTIRTNTRIYKQSIHILGKYCARCGGIVSIAGKHERGMSINYPSTLT